MKRLIAVTFCLFAASAVFGQNTAPQKSTTPQKSIKPQNGATTVKRGASKKDGPAIGGYILDNRKHPFAGAEVFIYNDSSAIIASGYTDATGHYETNAVPGGKYTVKVVYPSSKAILITGVVIKKGIVPINLTQAEPEADATLPFTNFVPVVEKKKPGPKAQKKP